MASMEKPKVVLPRHIRIAAQNHAPSEMLAATPLANFIEKNPTIVMLALAFLLMIGTTLIAEGMGFHVPKGYVYAAMAFSALVEVLNIVSRNARQRNKSS